MNEENTLEILKMLVDRVKELERQVLESEMMIIKSGYVAQTPRPFGRSSSVVPDNNTISKMSWSDLDNLVDQLEGQV
jgi:hypothetical protein|tara:strand:- start:210 stop:440 length:231 start_codon:yes stop_codon:yes gene_type:complete